MTRGISQYIWPLELPHHTLDRARVTRACQALALDEERTTFHPELWNERVGPPSEFDPDKPRFIKDEQLSQVWFAGVHSNVGGGYPDDTLAYIPFVWMITEAQRCGLKFKSDATAPPADPDPFKNAVSRRDKDGRIYDPRAGLGAYYRYGPRKLVQLCNPQYKKKEDDEVLIERPKIHETVFRRIDNRAHAYAPVGLPPVYDVVTEDGAILTPRSIWLRDRQGRQGPGGCAGIRLERNLETPDRLFRDRRRHVMAAGVSAAQRRAARRRIRQPDPMGVGHHPHRRRLPAQLRLDLDRRLRARARAHFLFLAGLVTFLIWWGMRIASRISGRMASIWRGVPAAPPGPPNNFIYRLRSNPLYIAFHEGLKRTWAPAFFALLLVYLGALADQPPALQRPGCVRG